MAERTTVLSNTHACASQNKRPSRIQNDVNAFPAGQTATDPATIDASATPGGQFLHMQAGPGIVDELAVAPAGSLTKIIRAGPGPGPCGPPAVSACFIRACGCSA